MTNQHKASILKARCHFAYLVNVSCTDVARTCVRIDKNNQKFTKSKGFAERKEMTIALNLIKYFLIGLVLPYLLAAKLTRKVETDAVRIVGNVLNGYIIMWAVMQLISVPMIYMHAKLSTFVWICMVFFLLISLWNLVSERHAIWNEWITMFSWLKRQGSMRVLLWCLMILQAIYVGISYLSNDDDAFYVASAQTSLDTNTMYAIDPYTGDYFSILPSRYVLSPFSLFVAFMARVVGVNAPTMAHTLLPMILILLVYVVYEIWARFLFPENIQAQTVFMLFVMVVLAFSDYTTHARGMMMFPRIWQGKAVLATILLPLILVLGMRMISYSYGRIEWFYLLVVMTASCFVSSMGIMLAVIEIGICGIIAMIHHRQIKQLIYTVLCCIPNLLYAVIYLVIR